MRFLFVDRILHSSPGKLIRGIKHITPDDHFLIPHDSNRYCFASSLIGEALGQLAAWNVMEYLNFTKRPVAGVVASATLHRPAFVGDTLLLESVIDDLDDAAVRYHSSAYVGNTLVFTVDGALGPLLPMSDFIDESDVRRQYAEIYRPEDGPRRDSLLTETLSLLPYEPRPASALMSFDAIIENVPGVGLKAIKKITRASAFFPDHFPNKPVLPMTVLLECKLHLAKKFMHDSGFQDYQVRMLRRIKMNEFVFPGDVVSCHLTLKQHDEQNLILQFLSEVDSKRVCVMELHCTRTSAN